MLVIILFLSGLVLPFPFGEGFDRLPKLFPPDRKAMLFLMLKEWVFAPSHVSERWGVKQHQNISSIAGLRGCIMVLLLCCNKV